MLAEARQGALFEDEPPMVGNAKVEFHCGHNRRLCSLSVWQKGRVANGELPAAGCSGVLVSPYL